MAKHWTKGEQSYLLDSIPAYRKEIKNKNLKEQRRITHKLANKIHSQYNDILLNRTPNSINERLPYLENLLAGVFEKQHYALKDQELYSTLPREDNCTVPNICNIRHSYNGAMKEHILNIK